MPWLTALACFTLTPGDIALPDTSGRMHSLGEWRTRPILVLAFVSAECPVARLYAGRLAEIATHYEARGVAIVGIDANPGDSASDLAKLANDLRLSYPLLRDANQLLASRLAVDRVPQVIVLDRHRLVRYRGRIDDQFGPGARKSKSSRSDLTIALDELRAEKPVSVPITPAAGCPLERKTAAPRDARVTYHRDVAPILASHCVRCHQPGGIAPFSLAAADEAVRRSRAIGEAVSERRMPPWHADPKYGRFANDPSLTDGERSMILDWCASGAARGEEDAPKSLPAGSAHCDGWQMGTPDLIVPIPEPFAVPAAGVIPYQVFEVDPGFQEDRWISEAEILPGNRAVVHHAILFLIPPGVDKSAGIDDRFALGELQSFCLAAYAMGTPPLTLPAGLAKKIPAGWRLLFEIHYVPNGSVQIDRTRLGLRFADPKSVRKEVSTNLLMAFQMSIPPRCPSHIETRSRTFEKDVFLLALFPHMHLRGVSFRYEATYPDGRTEILLSVPFWDLEWQNRYVFAEPKFLPAGTTLTAIGRYDNSAANPNNPDPDAEVHVGPQTTDEMFNGYYDFCLADQDLTRRDYRPWAAWVAALGLIGAWFGLRIRTNRRTA